MTRHVRIPLLIAVVLALCATPASAAPYQDPSQPTNTRVADLLSRMTLQEKVGQMTQTERATVDSDTTKITTGNLGSVLSGGGSTPAENTPEQWADMVDRFQKAALDTRLGIPIIYGVDSVHGHGNLLGATVFPHNIGLGATRDPALVRRIGHITAEETRASGPHTRTARTSTRSARPRTVASPAGRPRSRRCCSRTGATCCRCAAAPSSTWPAPTPTASATRPAAGRSPGRATRRTRSPATPSSTGSGARSGTAAA